MDNSDIYTNAATGVISYDIVDEGFGGGNALKGMLVRKNAYALIGFLIGEKPNGDSTWDFSEGTALTFYGKGDGTLNLSIESDTLDKLDFVKHYSADIVLHEKWQQYTISFDSLSLYDDGNPDTDIPWKESAHSIKRIGFNALENDTVTLWLDDLIIEGVDFSAVY